MKKSSKAIIGTIGALAAIGTAIEVKRIHGIMKEIEEIDSYGIDLDDMSEIEKNEYKAASRLNNIKKYRGYGEGYFDIHNWAELKKMELEAIFESVMQNVMEKISTEECGKCKKTTVDTSGNVSDCMIKDEESSKDTLFSKLYADDAYRNIIKDNEESKQKLHDAIEKANNTIEKDDEISDIRIDDSGIPEINEDDTDLSEFEDREYNE